MDDMLDKIAGAEAEQDTCSLFSEKQFSFQIQKDHPTKILSKYQAALYFDNDNKFLVKPQHYQIKNCI